MEISSNGIFSWELFEQSITGKIQQNFGNIIFIVLFILFLDFIKYLLQSEMKGNCPYCGREFLLNKQHQDKVCLICQKEFRLRNMKIYKGEDVVDEILYYITKAFACLTAMSGNITEEQKRHVESFGISQNITRRQFNDMKKVYNKTLKTAKKAKFIYRGIVNKLRLYVEEYYSSRQMFEMENSENNLLNILYNFALIDEEITFEEQKFFEYFKKVFNITDDRFNLVITYKYEEPKTTDTHTHENASNDHNKNDNGYNTEYTQDNTYQQNNTQENKNIAYNTKSQEYYNILECDSNVSDDELKKQYKKLMMQYHPDKYAANDLPEEIEKMLNNKMSELNEAYEQIKKERGIN